MPLEFTIRIKQGTRSSFRRALLIKDACCFHLMWQSFVPGRHHVLREEHLLFIAFLKILFLKGYIPNSKLLRVWSAGLRKVYVEELSCHFIVFVCLAMFMCYLENKLKCIYPRTNGFAQLSCKGAANS